LLMWILGTPQRKRKKALLEEELRQPNRSDSQAD